MVLRKSKIIFIGLIFIIISLGYYRNYFINYFDNIKDKINVDNYLLGKNNKLLAVIYIPKINLKKGIYFLETKENNVNKNIELLRGSTSSDILLAAHSGNGKKGYFNNIFNLKYNDFIYLYHENKKYIYEVIDFYKVEKDGYLKLDYVNYKRLVLTTCDILEENKQYVVIAKLIT